MRTAQNFNNAGIFPVKSRQRIDQQTDAGQQSTTKMNRLQKNVSFEGFTTPNIKSELKLQ